MKRRDFIRNMSAFSALPALPSQVLASSTVPPELFSKAAHLASIWVDTSANMMKNALQLDEKTSKSLFESLLNNNVVGAPNRFGVARAVVPCYENPIFIEKVNALTKSAKPVSTEPITIESPDQPDTLKAINDSILKETPEATDEGNDEEIDE